MSRRDADRALTPRALAFRRFFHRAEARVETLPPFAFSAFSASFIAAFAIYGMVLNGSVNKVANDVTASVGFAVESVAISGHRQLSERELLDILGLEPGLSLLTFDVASAHRTLLREPWIKSASVRKVYPKKLMIEVAEREPFAIWQRGHIVSVIDRTGLVLDHYDETQHSNLPILVGHGAQKNGAAFLALLRAHPELNARVRASLYRSERRWDLMLDNGVTVKLPERDVSTALAQLADYDQRHALFSKDVERIDMRLSDRLVLRLSDRAMINRLATIGQKAGKNAETNI
ncbi:MAG: cell division protein FtsQ/DivIB [Pseudomonadota bacterium]